MSSYDLLLATFHLTATSGSPPPLMERRPSRQAEDASSEGNGKMRAHPSNDALLTVPLMAAPQPVQQVAAGAINPLHLLSDAVALAFNMTAAPVKANVRGGVSGAGELVGEGHSERAGGKGAVEAEEVEGGIGTPYIVSGESYGQHALVMHKILNMCSRQALQILSSKLLWCIPLFPCVEHRVLRIRPLSDGCLQTCTATSHSCGSTSGRWSSNARRAAQCSALGRPRWFVHKASVLSLANAFGNQ